MGKVTREHALEMLRRENPAARLDDLSIYADAFVSYQEASANIEKNGVIVAHPRTGAPMTNPYAKLRDDAAKTMQRTKHVRQADALWQSLGTTPRKRARST